MELPVSTQTWPRTRPSVPSMAMVRTEFSPEGSGEQGNEEGEHRTNLRDCQLVGGV